MKRLLVVCALLVIALPALAQIGPTIKVRKTTTDTLNYNKELPVGSVKDSMLAVRTRIANMRIFNVKDYGGVGDSITDDRAAIQAAFTAAGSNSIISFPPGGIFSVSDTIYITGSNVTIEGNGSKIIQTTAGKKLFRVEGNGTKFRGLTIVGDTIAGNYNTGEGFDVGINFANGTSNQMVENCDISLLKHGIFAVRVDGLTVKNSYIHDVHVGIFGGYNFLNDMPNLDAVYLIDGNRIHCAFGDLTNSRPVTLYFGTNYKIVNNELRGGGMAFEALTDVLQEADTTYSRLVSNNNCDTPISAGNYSIVSGNTVDLNFAPAGRGILPDYLQGIEGGWRSTIVNNLVRHFPVGVAGPIDGAKIIGNTFESCGDTSLSTAFGVVTVFADYGPPDRNRRGNLDISHNTFLNSKSADIGLNYGQSDTLVNVTISHNKSSGGWSSFLLATNCIPLIVTHNDIRNACAIDSSTVLNVSTAYGMWESGDITRSYYDANTFTNTLSGGYGIYKAINAGVHAVVNFTRITGARNSDPPIELTRGCAVIGMTEVNDTLKSLQATTAKALIVSDYIKLNRDTTTVNNPVLYFDGEDANGAGTIVWLRGLTYDWALLTDPASNEIHFWDYHGTPGRRLTLHDSTGNVDLSGDLNVAGNSYAANGVSLRFNTVAFAASTRVAVYLPGNETTDHFVLSWNVTSDTFDLTGGRLRYFSKTDSLIIMCDSATSDQVTYIGPR